MTPAERIASLETEVAYLRSELGLSVALTNIIKVKQALGLARQEAHILTVLRTAYPRALSRYQLWDALEHPHAETDDHAENSINVRVSGIRRKVGRDLVDVVPTLGLRLTDIGAALVDRCLKPSTDSSPDHSAWRRLPQPATAPRAYTEASNQEAA